MNDGSRMSYADVVNTTRQNIPLAVIGVEMINMKKAMTGGIKITRGYRWFHSHNVNDNAKCPSVLLDRGSSYVAVDWAAMVVVGVYVSPNSGLAAFGDFLDEIGECARRCLPRQVLVLGNFNAHSSQWGIARTDTRGRMLSDWAADIGLLLVNRGSASTCVP